MTNCPFSKRSPESRVVVKVNCVSVQCWTERTRSLPLAAKPGAVRVRPFGYAYLTRRAGRRGGHALCPKKPTLLPGLQGCAVTGPKGVGALETRVTAVARQVARVEDTQAVKCLQY